MRSTVCTLVLFALCACNLRNEPTEKEAPTLVGAWRIVDVGVDAEGEPCPFIPDELEFFADGSVAASSLPAGRMAYKIVTDPAEQARVTARFPYARPGRTLLMMVDAGGDWGRDAMAYGYELDRERLVLEFPGWSPSVFGRRP